MIVPSVTSDKLLILDCGTLNRSPSYRRTRRASEHTSRQAVTLIELLIVIAIIATLSAVFLGVSTAAIETSRASRTKATIAKIHSLLMERWESYETRRIDLDTRAIDVLLREDRITARQHGEMLADMRLLGVRELMKLEMPDRWSDIIGTNVGNNNLPTDPNRIINSTPSLTLSYARRYSKVLDIMDPSKPEDKETILENQSAECLYLIIMLATGDGEARTLFGEQDIGDIDGDGAAELLDGWGQPIRFIRWPAGFADTGLSSLMTGDADADHDPLDPFRRDQPQDPTTMVPIDLYPTGAQLVIDAMRRRNALDPPLSGFRLLPLVYSAGADEDSDIITSGDEVVVDPYLDYTSGNPFTQTERPTLGGLFRNDNDGDNWIDNLHNHLQDNQ